MFLIDKYKINSLKDITEANVIKFLKKSELIDDIKYYFKDSENNYFALKLSLINHIDFLMSLR